MASQTRPLSSYHPHIILISSSYHSTRTMILFKNRGQEGIMILASQFIDWWMGFSPLKKNLSTLLRHYSYYYYCHIQYLDRQMSAIDVWHPISYVCNPNLPLILSHVHSHIKKSKKNPKRFSGKLAQTFPNKKGNSLEMIKIQKSTLLQ